MTIESPRKTVVYVGPFSFPDGGAAARRIIGNARSLQEAGFHVTVACGQSSPDGVVPRVFEGIEVVPLGERSAEHLPRLLKHLAYVTMGRKTVAWLEAQTPRPDAVILYSGYSPYLLRLIPWARSRRVPLIFDAVEWYDPATVLQWLSPYQLNIELAMRYLLPRVRNIITIGSFLADYYAKRGVHCLTVPPTLDVVRTPYGDTARTADRPLKLVYAGSPGNKDLLDTILEAVLRLHGRGHPLRLTVAGVPAEETANYRSIQRRPRSEVGSCVDFVGVLDHAASINLVRDADYSLLLRRDARYARAGFPTKFVESLAVGTPVMANLTSDLGRYLKDGETGFICSGPTSEELETALTRALLLAEERHASMRVRCRELAEQNFDFRAYTSPLSAFVDSAEV